jgi:hypothetical protein
MNDLRAINSQPVKIKHTCMHNGVVFIFQSIDVFINYLYCEYLLNWTFNAWFTCVLVLANQNEAHVHAHAIGDFKLTHL